ncbi:MAG: hypothetical protein HUU18_09425 [Phycisphaerales bacterium]|nr:hypothetical protein [Phycisphaerales bacterium]
MRKDVDLDGTINAADITAANAVTGGYHALGRGVLSAGGPGGAVGNRRGYAGYEYAPELEGTGAAGRHLYHVRHRVYDADVGRWTKRDPLGYVDGMGLYEYVKGMVVVATDPDGRVLLIACCAIAYVEGSRAISAGRSDKYAHCYATCLLSNLCTLQIAAWCASLKEFKDIIIDRDPWRDSLEDMIANSRCAGSGPGLLQIIAATRCGKCCSKFYN